MSSRFYRQQDRDPRRPGSGRAWRSTDLFAEGRWQTIRVTLEHEGWSISQIERVHDQLRQGWSLAMAKQNVAAMTGSCPRHFRPLG